MGTPDETGHLNLLGVLEQSIEISLIIPRLDVKGDDGLGGGLGLGGLLGGVLGESLLLELLSLLIDLIVVGSEKVDIIVVLLLSGGGRSLGTVGRGLLGGAGESRVVLLGSNVLEPSGGVGVLLGVRGRGNGLVDGDVSLRGSVANG